MGIFAMLVVSFAVYAWAEKKVVNAIEQRHQSFLLADEFRQTSDDLTKMVRIYVATGDVQYKDYYQVILDIRDGKRPRPLATKKFTGILCWPMSARQSLALAPALPCWS
jgi:hypothetical protein